MAKKRLKKGEGRLQVIANRDRISALAAQGYGPVGIYEILTREGLISMSYGGFYEAYQYGAVRKKRRKSGAKNVNTASTAMRSAQEKPSISPGVLLKDLDAALEEAAALREKSPKQSGKEGQGYSRKKVIG